MKPGPSFLRVARHSELAEHTSLDTLQGRFGGIYATAAASAPTGLQPGDSTAYLCYVASKGVSDVQLAASRLAQN